jgi:hypothetical protein
MHAMQKDSMHRITAAQQEDTKAALPALRPHAISPDTLRKLGMVSQHLSQHTSN